MGVPFKEGETIAVEYDSPGVGYMKEIGKYISYNEWGIVFEHSATKTLSIVNMRSSSVLLIRQLTKAEKETFERGE